MVNRVYPKAKQAMLSPGINLATAAVTAVLIDTGGYTYNAADEFLAAVPAGARIGTPQVLGSKTFTDGTFDAADISFPTVPAGSGSTAQLEGLVIYLDTGNAATSRLLYYVDTGSGLPVTPNGGNIDIAWPALGIFSL